MKSTKQELKQAYEAGLHDGFHFEGKQDHFEDWYQEQELSDIKDLDKSYTQKEVIDLCNSAKAYGKRHGDILWAEWIHEKLNK